MLATARKWRGGQERKKKSVRKEEARHERNERVFSQRCVRRSPPLPAARRTLLRVGRLDGVADHVDLSQAEERERGDTGGVRRTPSGSETLRRKRGTAPPLRSASALSLLQGRSRRPAGGPSPSPVIKRRKGGRVRGEGGRVEGKGHRENPTRRTVPALPGMVSW